MTSHFFSHIIAIDMYQISQGKIISEKPGITKEVFRTCNVLPFSCTHLALWRGKVKDLPKVHAKQKGFKNFFTTFVLYAKLSRPYIFFFAKFIPAYSGAQSKYIVPENSLPENRVGARSPGYHSPHARHALHVHHGTHHVQAPN